MVHHLGAVIGHVGLLLAFAFAMLWPEWNERQSEEGARDENE
jgi:hypothetical protein